MAITLPCIKAKMGSVVYYETTMTARELTHSVRAAREMDGWSTASIDERIQREVNERRVRNTIVPYLAQHPDRFFGSFIVLIQDGELIFESLSDVAQDLNGAYRGSAEKMGFLTINGGALIALDGQHRLLAFREVINPASGDSSHFAPDVGDDEVCVLFMEHETSQKTRRIFNKINRHAKPTGKSTNILISEDDGYALVARRLLDRDRGAPLAERESDGRIQEIVNWTSPSLRATTSKQLTTLAAVYETVSDILTFEGFTDFNNASNPVAPSEAVLDKAYEEAARWWDALLTMGALRDALDDPTGIPAVRSSHSDPHTLLLRPVGQMALVKGLVLALTRSAGAVSLQDLISRAEKVNWAASGSSFWRDILVKPDGRMIARKENYTLAARLLAYLLVPEHASQEEQHALFVAWNEKRGLDPHSPAEELEAELAPEELPRPVTG